MEFNQLISYLAITVSILAAILTTLTAVISRNKRREEERYMRMRYEEERNTKRHEEERYMMKAELAKLNDMRRYYESQIQEMNNELMSNNKRWMEVNHLLVSEKEKNHTQAIEGNLSIFLKNHGLTVEDLKIDKKSVFFLTPFIESEIPVFKEVKDICQNVGLKCSRGDEEFIKGDILPHILKKISQARLVIANIDGRNPNVYYELGIAHALDKPTILLTKSLSDTPFDLQSKNIIQYGNFNELEQKLTLALTKTFIDNE